MGRGGSRVRKKIVDELLEMSAPERATFFLELEAENQRRKSERQRPFPKLVKLYAHESEESLGLLDLNKALALDEDERWNPLYEVEFIVEVPEKPEEAKLVAVDGFMIDYDRPFDREDEIVKVDR